MKHGFSRYGPLGSEAGVAVRPFKRQHCTTHRDLKISPAEFDEVARELGRSLDFAKVPKREKAEVLAAFAPHKNEVTTGYVAAAKPR